MDFMYAISDGDGGVKIGVSKNPPQRVKSLQTGNHRSLQLLFSEPYECSRGLLLRVERKIHRELARLYKKKKGEWFLIDQTEYPQLKNLMCFYRIRYEDAQQELFPVGRQG